MLQTLFDGSPSTTPSFSSACNRSTSFSRRRNFSPNVVRRYSTRGGISGNWTRSKIPARVKCRSRSVSTLVLMPSMCRSRAPGRFTPPATARVALFLMDYPQRTRLKILGYARVEDAREHPELVAQIAEPVVHRLERLFCIEVVSFDWNCSQYITPRYTAGEIQELVATLQQRIAELEAAARVRRTSFA
jgi:hypothetical protein